MGNSISFNCSNCFPYPLVSSVPFLAVLISSSIVGTRRIILVATIIGLSRHNVVVYVHKVSMGPIVPAGVSDVFPINPLGRPICRSFWFLCNIEGIDPRGCLLELMVQVRYGFGEVFLWVIIVSLSAAAAVSNLMKASLVSSPFSLRLFVPWYPVDLVEAFFFCI